MSAKRTGPEKPGKRVVPERKRFISHRIGILLGIVLLLVLAGSWWWSAPHVSLPAIDVSQVDPKVAADLRKRTDEVRRHPRSASAWGWLGALLWAYDFRPAACECLAHAERLEPGNPRWPYYHALSLIIATPNQALPLFEKAARLCGNSPEAPRFRFARLLAEQGRWDEARREFEPLMKAQPSFSPARLLAARDAQQRGQIDQAIELASGCTEDPRTARASLVLLAALYRQKGNTEASAQALRGASSLPEDSGIGDPFQAEVTLLRGDPRALSEQSHPLLAGGRLIEAATLIDRLRQEHPDYADTWLLAGRLQYLRKDLIGAEPLLRRHVEMSPRSVQGLFQLGLVLLAQERFSEAASAFQKSTEFKPDFGPAHFNRGLALGRAGQTREAMAAFRESLRHNPERLESYLFLADLHLRAQETNTAVGLLDQAASIAPNDPRLRNLEGRARKR